MGLRLAPALSLAALLFAALSGCAAQRLSGHSEKLLWTGRVDRSDAAGPRFAWSGTQLDLRFAGTRATLRLKEGPSPLFEQKQRYQNRFRIELDGKLVAEPLAPPADGRATQWEWTSPKLGPGPHALRLVKETEAGVGEAQLVEVELEGTALSPAPRPARRLEVIGDSHVAGFGALGQTATCPFSSETESHSAAFAAVAARALSAEAHFIAFSGRGLLRNYDDDRPPERVPELWRRTLAGRAAPAWAPDPGWPDAVLLLVGSNDFGRGDPGEPFVAAYVAFLEQLRRAYPAAHLLALSREQQPRLVAYVARAVSQREAAGDRRLGHLILPRGLPEEGKGCVGHASVATHARHARLVVEALNAVFGAARARASASR